MRYASIREMDISNGYGVGVSFFTQGCHFHCKNCFNQQTWNFNGGKEYTNETEVKIRSLVDRPYIHRFSVLGGEPLEWCNIYDLTNLLLHIKEDADLTYKKMDVWLYTGYSLTDIIWKALLEFNPQNPKSKYTTDDKEAQIMSMLYFVDHLVDGQYEEDKKDFHLKFCGSSNQRIIDMKKTHYNYINDEVMCYVRGKHNSMNAAQIQNVIDYINKEVIVTIPQESL